MKYEEALKLEEGDLVTISSGRSKTYGGLVFEIESINPKHDNWCLRVTLKQPLFDYGFRLVDYDSRLLTRYES